MKLYKLLRLMPKSDHVLIQDNHTEGPKLYMINDLYYTGFEDYLNSRVVKQEIIAQHGLPPRPVLKIYIERIADY